MEPPCVKWRRRLRIAKHISPRDLFVGILRGVKIPWGFCVESDKRVTEGYHHVTPQKINMERKDHTVGKEHHLPSTSILGFQKSSFSIMLPNQNVGR